MGGIQQFGVDRLAEVNDGMNGMAPVEVGALPGRAWIQIIAVCLIGAWTMVHAIAFHGLNATPELAALVAVGMIASLVRVNIPGITVTCSANFIVLVYAIGHLDMAQTLVVGVASMIAQTLRARSGIQLLQAAYNASGISIAAMCASLAFSSGAVQAGLRFSPFVGLLVAAATLFLVNTGLTSMIIAATEGGSAWAIWRHAYAWSFPYYVLGASVARVVDHLGVESILVIAPLAYVLLVSFRLQVEKLEQKKKRAETLQRHAEQLQQHAEEVAAIHLRTIQALALAIEAKDDTTHDHLQRVQVYALEVGRELGLTADELRALEAASFLHDIGKIAVPDYIISKPGKLTPEEFEKMKVHPVVGAEILESVGFPYPVVPIVRAHHEKWDGKGYPYGLRGEEIPIGARILSAVDCLDALASHRQYRPALPIERAMEIVLSESGKAYDPKVVEVIHRRFLELETKAKSAVKAVDPPPKLSKELKISRGEAPAAGFQQSARESKVRLAVYDPEHLDKLFNGISGSLDLASLYETVEGHLRKLLPFDCIAVYLRHGDRLVPSYIQGDDSALFASLEIPMGQGLSGWVAENKKALLNGNPAVEPGYLNDPSRFTMLRSGLAVPLVVEDRAIGVIALYSHEKDAYYSNDLRLVQTMAPRLSGFVQSALNHKALESRNLIDEVTGLPNSAALFTRLDEEISRSRRTGTLLAVLSADLRQFRRVNERLGRAAGDRLLRQLASTLRVGCREYDTVARTGDDQFTIILPGCGPDSVNARVEGLTAAVEQFARTELGGSHELLSLAIGAATMPEDGTDAEGLMTSADERMHLTKAAAITGDMVSLSRATAVSESQVFEQVP
jgi:diguanylate cyclase (GGDEF)-like protein/putative nucleotidyltransferase with HDIG domain